MKKRQVQANWTCPTCNKLTKTPFCPTCGEQVLRARDLSLRVLADQLVESFTSIDSKLVRSFRFLVGRPGFLTVAFLRGQRKAYLGPVGLFLMCNVLFFAIEALMGGTAFNTPLQSHLELQPWSNTAKELVARKLQAAHTDLASYAPVFNQAMSAKARSLIILMALVFALAPALLFQRSKRQLVAHVVFSLHLYAWLLLMMCVATAIPAISHWFGGPGQGSHPLDGILSIGLVLACALYLYVATATVYEERGVSRVVKTVVLTVIAANVALGYRFVLLLVTLYST